MTTEQNNVITSLSTREVQVLDFLSRGLTEKEIAGKLFISSATVNNHTRHIREKFGLSKNTEMFLQCMQMPQKFI